MANFTPEQLGVIERVKENLAKLDKGDREIKSIRCHTDEATDKKILSYKIKGEWVEVEEAISVDADAYDSFKLELADYLEEYGKPAPFGEHSIPPVYKKLGVKVLRGEIERPVSKGRTPTPDKYKKNIISAVAALELVGINPTTSSTKTDAESFTGCGIVANCFRGLSYDSVKNIWTNREKDPVTRGITQDIFVDYLLGNIG